PDGNRQPDDAAGAGDRQDDLLRRPGRTRGLVRRRRSVRRRPAGYPFLGIGFRDPRTARGTEEPVPDQRNRSPIRLGSPAARSGAGQPPAPPCRLRPPRHGANLQPCPGLQSAIESLHLLWGEDQSAEATSRRFDKAARPITSTISKPAENRQLQATSSPLLFQQ